MKLSAEKNIQKKNISFFNINNRINAEKNIHLLQQHTELLITKKSQEKFQRK